MKTPPPLNKKPIEDRLAELQTKLKIQRAQLDFGIEQHHNIARLLQSTLIRLNVWPPEAAEHARSTGEPIVLDDVAINELRHVLFFLHASYISLNVTNTASIVRITEQIYEDLKHAE